MQTDVSHITLLGSTWEPHEGSYRILHRTAQGSPSSPPFSAEAPNCTSHSRLFMYYSFLFFTMFSIINASVQDIIKCLIFSLSQITRIVAGDHDIEHARKISLLLQQRRWAQQVNQWIFVFSINCYWFAPFALYPPQELLPEMSGEELPYVHEIQM